MRINDEEYLLQALPVNSKEFHNSVWQLKLYKEHITPNRLKGKALQNLPKEYTAGTGTGFLFKKASRVYLVSNTHVYEDGNPHTIMVFHSDPEESYPFIMIPLNKSMIVKHDTVDLALIDITDVIANHPALNVRFLTQSDMLEGSSVWYTLGVGRHVSVVGFQAGGENAVHVPAQIQSIPENPWYGEPKIELNVALFPGSSGSPTFVYVKDSFGNITPKLLGVADESAINKDNGQIYAGHVIKSTALQTLIEKAEKGPVPESNRSVQYIDVPQKPFFKKSMIV